MATKQWVLWKKDHSPFFLDNKKLWSLYHPRFFKQRCDTVGWLQHRWCLDGSEPRRAAFHPLGVARYFGRLDRIFRSTYQRTRQPTMGNPMTRKSLFEKLMGFLSRKETEIVFLFIVYLHFFLNKMSSLFLFFSYSLGGNEVRLFWWLLLFLDGYLWCAFCLNQPSIWRSDFLLLCVAV